MKVVSAITMMIFSVLLFSCSSIPKQAQEIVEMKKRASEYADYGNGYYSQGMYDQALHFFKLSLAYNGIIYNETGIVLSHNSIGKVFFAMGDKVQAEKSFSEALRLALLLGKNELIVQSINNIGELYLKEKEYDLALKKFVEALGYAKSLEPEKVAIVYHNIGVVYKRKNDAKTSLDYLRKALGINSGKKYHQEIASNCYMISSVFMDTGDYEQAKSYALKALKEDKAIENSFGIAKDFQALGIILSRSGKNPEAYEYFKKSLFVYESLIILYPALSLSKEKAVCLNFLIPLAQTLENKEDAKLYESMLKDLK